MEIIKWIEAWYESQCDGDWEHQQGIRIETLDNPGWRVEIDLTDTDFDNLSVEYELIEKSEEDWYGVSVKEARFVGVGDPAKLEVILCTFRQIIEGQR